MNSYAWRTNYHWVTSQFLGNSWRVLAHHASKVLDEFLASSWRIPGEFLESFGEFLATAWRVLGEFCRVFGELLSIFPSELCDSFWWVLGESVDALLKRTSAQIIYNQFFFLVSRATSRLKLSPIGPIKSSTVFMHYSLRRLWQEKMHVIMHFKSL